MFKLGQVSDAHAGYQATRLVNAQGINLREADGYVVLSRIVTEMIEAEVDATVWPGDIFHGPKPDIRTIIFVQNQLRRLWDAGIPSYLLAGNHDTNDIKADIAASKVLNDPWRKIFSHAEPYAQHEIAPGIHLHMISHHMYGEQAATMSQVKPVEGEINILSTHGSIFDKYLHEVLHADQSPREIIIPNSLVDDHNWDYSLFGHIHERGWLGSKDGKTDTANSKVYYDGSIIRRGFSDGDVPLGRGWTLWEIGSDGSFKATPKKVAQRPQYDFALIDAKDMTASEVSDQIVESLKATQINGTTFDPKSAPILRQKLINLSAAKQQSLDWKAINLNSAHAMAWAVRPAPYITSTDSNGEKIEAPLIERDNIDVVKGYDDWVTNAPSLKSVEKDTKEKVIEQAREFVKLGQEESLAANAEND